MLRLLIVVFSTVPIILSCSSSPGEPNIYTDYPYILEPEMDDKYVAIEGYLMQRENELVFEPLGSRDAGHDYLIRLEFSDQAEACLSELQPDRGMLWSTYRSGVFTEFVLFSSYQNLTRGPDDEPVGCWTR